MWAHPSWALINPDMGNGSLKYKSILYISSNFFLTWFHLASVVYICIKCAKLLENSNNGRTEKQSNWHLPARREEKVELYVVLIGQMLPLSLLDLKDPLQNGHYSKGIFKILDLCCLVGFKWQPDACCLFLWFHLSFAITALQRIFGSLLFLPSAMSLVLFISPCCLIAASLLPLAPSITLLP